MSLERCRCGRLRCAHRAGSTARRAPSKEGAPHAARHRRGRRSDQRRARRRERYVREGCPVRAATRRRADGVGRRGEHVARHGPRERWSPVHGGGVLHRPERLGPGVRVRSLQLPGRVRLQARRGVGTRRDGHRGPTDRRGPERSARALGAVTGVAARAGRQRLRERSRGDGAGHRAHAVQDPCVPLRPGPRGPPARGGHDAAGAAGALGQDRMGRWWAELERAGFAAVPGGLPPVACAAAPGAVRAVPVTGQPHELPLPRGQDDRPGRVRQPAALADAGRGRSARPADGARTTGPRCPRGLRPRRALPRRHGRGTPGLARPRPGAARRRGCGRGTRAVRRHRRPRRGVRVGRGGPRGR